MSAAASSTNTAAVPAVVLPHVDSAASHVAAAPTHPSRARSSSRHDVSQLNDVQKAALGAMRAKLKETPLGAEDDASEYTHLRFLRARKFHVDDAIAQYTEYLRWRRDAHIDSVLRHPPTELRRLLSTIVPESFHHYDKFGLPAYFIKAGKVNPTLLLKYVTVDDLVQTHLWGQEYSFQRAEEKSQELGRNIDQFVNVVDLAGLTLGHRTCLKYMSTIAALDQKYYPESLGKTFIINAPWIFPTIWGLVKGWLDPVTVTKIEVLGADYQSVLKERFDADSLPAEYGGACHCQPNGCVPVYTEADAERVVAEQEQALHLQSVVLAPSQVHAVKFDVGPSGATFAYYFRSTKADIGFTAVFTGSDGRVTVWQRHEKFGHGQPWKGKFVATTAGAAVFTFDNKHAWRHTETFSFTVQHTDGQQHHFDEELPSAAASSAEH